LVLKEGLMPFLSAKSKEREVRKVVLVFVYVQLFTHYSGTPITAGSKWLSPPVLGGVGFNSLVIDGAITAGFKPDGDSPNNHRRF